MDFTNYEEKVFSSFPYFFTGKNGEILVTKFTMVMEDAVDGSALHSAAVKAAQRFPFLSERVDVREDGIYLKYNPRPLAVIRTDSAVELCAAETNYHLHAITYFGNRIELHAWHGLYDGIGGNYFRETLMYYYCCEKYGDVSAPEKVRLVGEEICEKEYLDPYENACLEAAPSAPTPALAPEICYDIASDNELTGTERACYVLRADEKSFVDFSKENNSSVFAMAAILFARAIGRYRTDSTPIILDYPANLRQVLGAPEAHHSAVTMFPLSFSDDELSMPLPVLGSEIKAYIRKYVSEGSLTGQAIRQIAMFRRLSGAPIKVIADTLRKRYSTVMSPCGIGYVGRLDWGEINRHIRYSYSTANYPCRLMCQVNTAGGVVFAFTQTFSEDKYIRALSEELTANGIANEITSFPRETVSSIHLSI